MTYPLLITAVAITEKLWSSQPVAHAAITQAIMFGLTQIVSHFAGNQHRMR
jgi:hypothetical protein